MFLVVVGVLSLEHAKQCGVLGSDLDPWHNTLLAWRDYDTDLKAFDVMN